MLAHRVEAADDLVHARLGRGRLVGLVVAVAAVADQVDDHVLLELARKSASQASGEQHRFRIVAVDVQNGRLDHLGDFGAVQGRAGIDRVARW
jgi:hypothetical protein